MPRGTAPYIQHALNRLSQACGTRLVNGYASRLIIFIAHVPIVRVSHDFARSVVNNRVVNEATTYIIDEANWIADNSDMTPIVQKARDIIAGNWNRLVAHWCNTSEAPALTPTPTRFVFFAPTRTLHTLVPVDGTTVVTLCLFFIALACLVSGALLVRSSMPTEDTSNAADTDNDASTSVPDAVFAQCMPPESSTSTPVALVGADTVSDVVDPALPAPAPAPVTTTEPAVPVAALTTELDSTALSSKEITDTQSVIRDQGDRDIVAVTCKAEAPNGDATVTVLQDNEPSAQCSDRNNDEFETSSTNEQVFPTLVATEVQNPAEPVKIVYARPADRPSPLTFHTPSEEQQPGQTDKIIYARPAALRVASTPPASPTTDSPTARSIPRSPSLATTVPKKLVTVTETTETYRHGDSVTVKTTRHYIRKGIPRQRSLLEELQDACSPVASPVRAGFDSSFESSFSESDPFSPPTDTPFTTPNTSFRLEVKPPPPPTHAAPLASVLPTEVDTNWPAEFAEGFMESPRALTKEDIDSTAEELRPLANCFPAVITIFLTCPPFVRAVMDARTYMPPKTLLCMISDIIVVSNTAPACLSSLWNAICALIQRNSCDSSTLEEPLVFNYDGTMAGDAATESTASTKVSVGNNVQDAFQVFEAILKELQKCFNQLPGSAPSQVDMKSIFGDPLSEPCPECGSRGTSLKIRVASCDGCDLRALKHMLGDLYHKPCRCGEKMFLGLPVLVLEVDRTGNCNNKTVDYERAFCPLNIALNISQGTHREIPTRMPPHLEDAREDTYQLVSTLVQPTQRRYAVVAPNRNLMNSPEEYDSKRSYGASSWGHTRMETMVQQRSHMLVFVRAVGIHCMSSRNMFRDAEQRMEDIARIAASISFEESDTTSHKSALAPLLDLLGDQLLRFLSPTRSRLLATVAQFSLPRRIHRQVHPPADSVASMQCWAATFVKSRKLSNGVWPWFPHMASGNRSQSSSLMLCQTLLLNERTLIFNTTMFPDKHGTDGGSTWDLSGHQRSDDVNGTTDTIRDDAWCAWPGSCIVCGHAVSTTAGCGLDDAGDANPAVGVGISQEHQGSRYVQCIVHSWAILWRGSLTLSLFTTLHSTTRQVAGIFLRVF
ncbi:hypothetical protein FISHEDRAFT_60177 [Fistulina hepatica ATCC 64428]|uniref:Uncharacterized protein n=1 Tax=Fistulina hepatica ATCC 64428 TaxID=1128425 RepID=A0A0D7A7G0_9AGAR|nr:hypothetical protein FISHEDRAFT_60177 [Fistulina hepatica ATCC 64428]